MSALPYRFNRFTKSYLINYKDFEFEADPELFTIIQTYYTILNIPLTLRNLETQGIVISKQDLLDIIQMVEHGHATRDNYLRSRTFQVINFKHFNFILDHKVLAWFLFIVFFLIGI